MKPTAADQLSLLGDQPETVWVRKDGAKSAQGSSGAHCWPDAWDADRPAKIRALLAKEKWTVAETAFYFDASGQHVVNSLRLVQPGAVHAAIDEGRLVAIDIARVPGSRPLYRIYRDSVLAFEKARRVGADFSTRGNKR